MSLRKAFEIRRTLVFRLTFWYALVYIVSSLAAFAVFYIVIANEVRERTDQEMLRELAEAASILKSKGEDSFRAEMDFEAESEGVGDIFFRLLDRAGGEVAETDMTAWKGVGINLNALARVAAGGGPVFETVAVPGKPYEARIIYGLLESGRIIQIGCSLEHDAAFLGTIQDMVMPGILVVVALSTLTGWFMAARALAGIKDVTRTALDISEGAFEKRVNIQARGEEVKQLAVAFNRMLDRIHELVKGLREVTDDIAHDLRTPITRIRGFAEAELIAGKSGEESNKLAADTVEECDNLLQMINTMLEISEIEAGISVLSKAEVDLVQLVGEALELFRPIADEREVRLVFHGPAHLSVQGNVHGLQRIVVNLLENAVKYTPGGGCVTVALRGDEHAVSIIFRDTGVGIAEEDLPLVFNRLYRCDSSRSQPGFGLGLCLASAVARAHGGRIAAESKLGEGSTFTVTLPR
ncbi:MAG TPA: ATP-binding protein [Syntrophales bacterium]|nr:ATP-binding protein [Syntrophales bacterium]HRT27226.1 ATP-binding protein [Syntrophales bacterium]HRT70058.1 ATP-binding protein [Syntrophales bacterium]